MSIQDSDYFLIDDGGVVKKIRADKLLSGHTSTYSSDKLLVNLSDYSSRFVYASDILSKIDSSHWMILDRAGQNYKVNGTKILEYFTPETSSNVYESTLRSGIPDWLTIHSGKSSSYRGFDSNGMWITGNSTSSSCYPVRTSFTIPSDKGFILKVSINKNHSCSDHGIAIYKDGTSPQWQWGANNSRIAYQFNCSTPYFYGTTSQSGTRSHSNNWYSMQIDYDGTSMRARTWSGQNNFSGSTFSDYLFSTSMSLANIYVTGSTHYRIAFDADQDSTSYKSYWKDMSIEIVD